MGTWGRAVAEISGAKESTGHIGDKGTKAWGTRLGSPWHTVTVGMAFVAAASRGLIALLERHQPLFSLHAASLPEKRFVPCFAF